MLVPREFNSAQRQRIRLLSKRDGQRRNGAKVDCVGASVGIGLCVLLGPSPAIFPQGAFKICEPPEAMCVGVCRARLSYPFVWDRYAEDLSGGPICLSLKPAILKLPSACLAGMDAIFHSANMTFAHYDFKRGASIHEHFHPQEEVYEVIEGELELTLEGATQIVRAGLVAIVPSNAPHSLKALTDGRAIIVDYPLRREFE